MNNSVKTLTFMIFIAFNKFEVDHMRKHICEKCTSRRKNKKLSAKYDSQYIS